MNSHWVKQEIGREFEEHPETNGNKNTTHQILGDTAKAVLRGQSVPTCSCSSNRPEAQVQRTGRRYLQVPHKGALCVPNSQGQGRIPQFLPDHPRLLAPALWGSLHKALPWNWGDLSLTQDALCCWPHLSGQREPATSV